MAEQPQPGQAQGVAVEELPLSYWGVPHSPDIIARLRTSELWEDPQFPPNDSSLFYNSLARPTYQAKSCEWKRASELFSEPEMVKSPKPESSNVIQGALGDCWFLSALSVVATRPDLMKNLIVEEHPECGFYEFRFFKAGSWRTVAVDNFLPITEWGQPIMGRSMVEGELWVSLMEKAYAKLHGHYQCLNGGSVGYALTDLTAGATERVNLTSEEGRELLGQNLLLHKLRQARAERWLAAALFQPSTAKIAGRSETSAELGLVAGHAYTLLDIRQIPAGGVWLVRLRNPWGQAEWKGAWSDHSRDWTQQMLDFLEYEFSEDGTFWMSLTDFQLFAGEVYICRTYRNPLGCPFYTISDLKGSWEGPAAGGQSSLKNPQYIISSEVDTSAFVFLVQTDNMYETKECGALDYSEKCIGFWALHCPDGGRVGSRALYKSSLAAPPSPFVRARSVGRDITLKAGCKYAIMPAQYSPGVEANYQIYFHSPCPIWVQKTDITGTEYDWVQSQECSLASSRPDVQPQEEARPLLDALGKVAGNTIQTQEGDLEPFDPSFRGQVFEVQFDPSGRDEIVVGGEDSEVNGESTSLQELHGHKREAISRMISEIVPAVEHVDDAANMTHLHETIEGLHKWLTGLLGETTMAQINRQAAASGGGVGSPHSPPRGRPRALVPVGGKETALAPAPSNPSVQSMAGVSNSFIFDDEIRALFDTYDREGTGYITTEEFKLLYSQLEPFGQEEPGANVEQIVNKHNTLGSKITYDEFALIMLGLSKR